MHYHNGIPCLDSFIHSHRIPASPQHVAAGVWSRTTDILAAIWGRKRRFCGVCQTDLHHRLLHLSHRLHDVVTFGSTIRQAQRLTGYKTGAYLPISEAAASRRTIKDRSPMYYMMWTLEEFGGVSKTGGQRAESRRVRDEF